MNVVVTGGGTVAPIDDVRSIHNTSTGRFSAAISEACLRRGARVHHIHVPGSQLPFHREARLNLDCSRQGLQAELARLQGLWSDYQEVRDRLDLIEVAPGTVGAYAEVLEQVLRREAVDVVFLAMAVSDFEPDLVAGKIPSSRDSLLISCRRTPKVIRKVRDWSPNTFLVGFKLLSGASPAELIRRAEDACRENRADATVANDLSTIREGRHAVHLVRPDAAAEMFGPGKTMAYDLVGRVLDLAAQHTTATVPAATRNLPAGDNSL